MGKGCGLCLSESADSRKSSSGDSNKLFNKSQDSTRISSEWNTPISQEPNMDYAQVAAYLKNVPLLSRFTDQDRDVLARSLLVHKYADGAKVIQEGDVGNEFFIIKEGQVRVTKFNTDQQKDVEIAILKKGDYFGEMALLNDSKRGATITAVGPVICFSMMRDKFTELFGPNKLNVTFAKRTGISAETNQSNEKADVKRYSVNNVNRTKTQSQRQMILDAIRDNILFSGLNEEQRMFVVNEMWCENVPKGANIIKQGDLGNHWYVVESGHFDIFVKRDQTTTKVAQRSVGSSFGELALMYNAPRAATVTSTVDSCVWVLDRWTFRRTLAKVSDQKLKEYEEFLKNVKSFEVLLDYERSQIADALEEVSYPDGHTIVKQGEQGDAFFILKRGEVVVTKTTNGQTLELVRYKPGDYFGERALMKNEERAATCTAVGPVVCLYLNREAFSTLLGPLEDIFQQRVETYSSMTGTRVVGQPQEQSIQKPSQQQQPQQQSQQQQSQQQQQQGALSPRQIAYQQQQQQYQQEDNYLRNDIKLNDLRLIGTLGKGSFGHVQLVKHPGISRTFALKCVRKSQIVRLGQQDHIMSEKRVMAQLDHPFLIKLFATFKDSQSLYFLLEPCLGGELFTVLRARTYFDEDTARFYAAGVILAFEYMHNKGIIYRDLKPENLLLDDRGYIKITDFGFAKKVGDNRTWTLCGTPDYLAPEVVSGQGHGKGVDWWTLGILIYEMLASYPPFYDEDPMKTYAKIMAGNVGFPVHFSRNAVDLIKRLLHPKATKRLGAVAGGAAAIKSHPWFAGFDWEAFYHKKLRAPIIMPVRGPEDLSNFEVYPDDGVPHEKYIPDPKNPDWDKEF